jgi:hypothetical protein
MQKANELLGWIASGDESAHHVEVDIMALAFEHTINVLGLHQAFDFVLMLLFLDVEAHIQWLTAVTLRFEASACIIAIVVDRVETKEPVRSWILCTCFELKTSA